MTLRKKMIKILQPWSDAFAPDLTDQVLSLISKRVEGNMKDCVCCDNDDEEQDSCHREHNQALSDILVMLKGGK